MQLIRGHRARVLQTFFAGLLLCAAGCSNPGPVASNSTATAPAGGSPATGSSPGAADAKLAAIKAEEEAPLPPLKHEAELPEAVRGTLSKVFTGDLDEMTKHRLIRVGVTYNRTHYFVDNGVQRGLAYEYTRLMEDRLNEVLKTGNLKIHVVPLAMPRDELIPALIAGKIDAVGAQLTVTPERQALVDFTVPTRRDVNEIPVTPKGSPALASADDLSGRDVFVRKSSSYYQSLLALNTRLAAAGRKPVQMHDAPESLEDDDLLEMVHAKLLPAIIVDNYVAEFWAQVFPNLQLHKDAAVRTDGHLAVAIRKNNPKAKDALNQFAKRYGIGTAFYNMMQKKYLQSTKFATGATEEAERKKFEALLVLFRKYGQRYTLDYLLMAAQGYQESRLDNNAKSHVGAIGVMQIMPATGADLKVGDIKQLEPNIHGGVKYIRMLIDDYYGSEPMDDINKMLFAFASYNAGPGRIRQLRREATRRGLNNNVWFGNVEQIVSERIGRETVTYVSNIFKYYVAYKLVMQQEEERAKLKSGLSAPKS